VAVVAVAPTSLAGGAASPDSEGFAGGAAGKPDAMTARRSLAACGFAAKTWRAKINATSPARRCRDLGELAATLH
jgi:hypothetical protein